MSKPRKEAKKANKPLSEDEAKFRPEWSKDDCIAELKRIAQIDPTQMITRNYFRNHAQCSEATWNRYFGTFLEFKRQAGIILSRHAHQLERSIAKHASKDTARQLQEEKQSWEGAYERPFGGRWQSILCGSDMHDIFCDPFYRRLFVETAHRVQPEKIVLNGDIFDLTEFGKYSQDPREFNVRGRVVWVHALLEDLRTVAPEAEITFVEGNHEFRLLRHMAEATPAMMTVLADLHNLSVADLLGLSKYEVNYVARMDLSAFNERDIGRELRKNYVIFHDCILFHHFPHGFDMGYPGVNGHHHKHLTRIGYNPQFGPYEWHQIGCGHRREASYTEGEKWSNGFILCHIDTHKKRTQFEYIDVTHDGAFIGGVFYTRSDAERVHAA